MLQSEFWECVRANVQSSLRIVWNQIMSAIQIGIEFTTVNKLLFTKCKKNACKPNNYVNIFK